MQLFDFFLVTYEEMHSLILSDQRNVLPASSRATAELSLSANNSLSTVKWHSDVYHSFSIFSLEEMMLISTSTSDSYQRAEWLLYFHFL